MAALTTRDDLEADFAARLAKLSERHRRELAKLLGDPPDILNVPDEFWRRVEREAEETAAAIMLLIFLAASEEHGYRSEPAELAAQGYVVNRAAFFAESWAATSRDMLATASDRWRQQRQRVAEELQPGRDGATATGTVTGIDPDEVDDVLLSIFGPNRVAAAAVTETTAAEYGGGNAAAEASTTPFLRVWQHGSSRPRRHAGAAHDPCPICTPLLGLTEEEWKRIHPDLAGPGAHPSCDCYVDFVDPATRQPIKFDFGNYGFLPPTGEKSLHPLALLRASDPKNCGTGDGGFKPGNTCQGGGGSGVKVKKSKKRAWSGEAVELDANLSKLETGALGEQVAIGYLKSLGFKDADTLNVDVNNFPVDLIHNHEVIEVKTGLASNSKSAQQWRATIGQPGQKERDWLKTASAEDKAAWNAAKQAEIMKRKKAVVKEYSSKYKKQFTGKTMCLILNPDTSTADVYLFDAFHHRIAWNSDMAKSGYRGSFRYE